MTPQDMIPGLRVIAENLDHQTLLKKFREKATILTALGSSLSPEALELEAIESQILSDEIDRRMGRTA